MRPHRIAFPIILALSLTAGRGAAYDGDLLQNHDGSFELAYSWGYRLQPPDHGSFAEGFEGTGEVTGMAVYLTTANGLSIAEPDLYIWESVDAQPGAVITVVPRAFQSPIAFWPGVSRHDATIEATVSGPFFAGLWPNFGDDMYYVAADLNGPGGTPRTKVPPGQDPAPGWRDVNDVWNDGIRSLGIEVYLVRAPTATKTVAWGRVKDLYR